MFSVSRLSPLTHPPCSCYVGPVVDVEMIVAVHLKPLKLQQELLNDGFRLEGDDTVLVSLVLTVQDDSIHGLLNLGEKISLLALITELVHLI